MGFEEEWEFDIISKMIASNYEINHSYIDEIYVLNDMFNILVQYNKLGEIIKKVKKYDV